MTKIDRMIWLFGWLAITALILIPICAYITGWQVDWEYKIWRNP